MTHLLRSDTVNIFVCSGSAGQLVTSPSETLDSNGSFLDLGGDEWRSIQCKYKSRCKRVARMTKAGETHALRIHQRILYTESLTDTEYT